MRWRLLSFKCLLGSMVLQWDTNGKPLFLHINSKWLFTSIALLFSSCNFGTIPETAMIFSFFFQDILKSIIELAIWLAVRSVLRLLKPSWSVICCGIMSRVVGLTWSYIQLTFAVVNGRTLTVPLCLFFSVRR